MNELDTVTIDIPFHGIGILVKKIQRICQTETGNMDVLKFTHGCFEIYSWKILVLKLYLYPLWVLVFDLII